MMNLDNLQSDTLPRGLELGSADLDLMRTLAENKDYSGLRELAAQLADQQIWDIRVLIYVAYGDIRDEGLLGLPRLLEWLNALFSDKWQGVGPEAKRNIYAKSSLAWLFSTLRVDFQTYELNEEALWASWLSGYTLQDLDAVLGSLNAFGHTIREYLGEELAGDPNGKITELSNWLKGIAQKLPRPEESEPEPATQEVILTQDATFTQSRSAVVGDGIAGSIHLDLLTKKLALFERVIDSGDMVKSAVVAADIMEIIEHFDPRVYFPSLFARYFSLLVPNIDEINELFSMRETPQFQALNSLYQVDMDSFLSIDLKSRYQ